MACLLALLRQMSDKHYQQLLQGFSSKDDLRVRPPNLSVYTFHAVCVFSYSNVSLGMNFNSIKWNSPATVCPSTSYLIETINHKCFSEG